MNPFIKHRAKVLGHYATASWLRQAVLCMRDGIDFPLSLRELATCDEAHFNAFVEMLAHYRLHGDNDLAFMTLAQDCLARREAENQAKARAQRFGSWCVDVKSVLRQLGLEPGQVDDRYELFEARFDAGMTPADAAAAARSDRPP